METDADGLLRLVYAGRVELFARFDCSRLIIVIVNSTLCLCVIPELYRGKYQLLTLSALYGESGDVHAHTTVLAPSQALVRDPRWACTLIAIIFGSKAGAVTADVTSWRAQLSGTGTS
jgi:uncharacterized membrane protein